jgi:hypothetical protein
MDNVALRKKDQHVPSARHVYPLFRPASSGTDVPRSASETRVMMNVKARTPYIDEKNRHILQSPDFLFLFLIYLRSSWLIPDVYTL